MKHAQKMVMIPEHLLQSIETEHGLKAPAQLTTLTRLDQDMKQIMECSLPEVLLMDQLLQRYQGVTDLQPCDEMIPKRYYLSVLMTPAFSVLGQTCNHMAGSIFG